MTVPFRQEQTLPGGTSSSSQLAMSGRGAQALDPALVDWIEASVGGKIVTCRAQGRWRAHFFLEAASYGGGSIGLLLRGARAAGIVESLPETRRRLEFEAQVLQILNELPIKTARFYAYNPTGPWLLMEQLVGSEKLTQVSDIDLQTDLFCQYMEDIATLHKFDLDDIELPAMMTRPSGQEQVATVKYRSQQANYRRAGGSGNPLLEFAWWWLERNPPQPPDRYSFCTGDIGADQFFFRDRTYVGMFDLEMAHIGDPVQDIGLMRWRNVGYPVHRFEDVVRRYYASMGRRLDLPTLNYWSVVGLLGITPTCDALLVKPDSRIPFDMTMVWGTHSRRRALATLLLQIHGFDTPSLPALPAGVSSPASKYIDYVVDELADYHIPALAQDEDLVFRLGHIRAHAEVAQRYASMNDEIVRHNLEDLSEVLNRTITDEKQGLMLLEDEMMRTPERNVGPRLNAIFRIETRREFLLQPCARMAGFPSFGRLDSLSSAAAGPVPLRDG